MEGAFTVVDALIACGVNNNVLFMEQTQAQRIASDIFDNTFTSCMDVTFRELDEHFKTYFDLTAAQGQIRLNPGIRKNIKAFVQWVRDEIRLGRDPTDTAFPIERVTDLIRRYHTHEIQERLEDSGGGSKTREVQGGHEMGGLETNFFELYSIYPWSRWRTIELARLRQVNPSWEGGTNKPRIAKIGVLLRLPHAVVLRRQPLLRSAFNDPPTDTAAYNECDSNADTCCLGTNFVVLQSTYRTADVYAYDSSIKPIENVPIVTGATAYDDPTTGTTFILVFHESLYYGTALDHSLINPNQLMRTYSFALHTAGTKIHFRTRVPSAQELQDCAHVQMTSSSPWDPTNLMMVQALHQGGTTMPAWQRPLPQLVPSFPPITEYLEATSNDALLHSIDPSLVRVGELLSKRLQQASEVDTTVYEHLDIPARRTFVSTERHAKVSAELLADRFGIGPKRAQRTLRVTTQRGMRSAILPIGRRYRADRVFGVKRLSGKFATDTAYGKLKSLRGNVGCQIYSHKCGFKVAYPLMKVDGNHVGDSLTQFISDFGVPAQLTFDGASVQTGPKTRFMDAIRRYEIKYHVSGPRRPNENPAEQSIHEIKKDGIVSC
ncbi:hypothetical protein MHU86_12596 [Fragilaria crotonensis]|nr:hypothetical protein MHU86_12596 [Fragilaria crotonensis]